MDFLQRALHLDLVLRRAAVLQQADVFRPDREGSAFAEQALRQLAAHHVGGADELGDERRLRPHVKLARRIHLFDAAVIEHRDPIGHRQRFALIVGDEDKGDTQLALQLLQLALHLLAQFEIQRAERFVQQQHPRPIDQRARQRHALPLAARQVRRLAFGNETERHALQRLLRPRQPLAFSDALHHQAVGDIFQHRHVREQRVILKHGIHVALIRRQVGGFLAVDANRAGSELFKAGDQAQAGGFARAGRPEHGEEFPVLNVDGYPIHGANIAESPRNIDELHGNGHDLHSKNQMTSADWATTRNLTRPIRKIIRAASRRQPNASPGAYKSYVTGVVRQPTKRRLEV